MTKFSGGYGPEFDGNSILLHMRDLSYIYIGSEIYWFRALSKIIDFVSPVGNNDVPYSYAIDDCENTYLLSDTDTVLKGIQYGDDPYEYFYGHRLLTSDLGSPSTIAPNKDYQQIKKFILGDEQYTLTYSADPEHEYDRLTSNFGKMYIVDTSGYVERKREYTKEMYINLMNSFGLDHSFEKIKDKVVLQYRL